MKVDKNIATAVIALAISIFLFAETSRADEQIGDAFASSFVFTNAKDGKRTIICRREIASFVPGTGSFDKKKKRWSWKRYQTDINKILKPGKKLSKSKIKQLYQLYAKAEAAEQQCVATERPRILGTWFRQYGCENGNQFQCLENYYYSFEPDGLFQLEMHSGLVCPRSGNTPSSAGSADMYIAGFYSFNGFEISLYPTLVQTQRSSCGGLAAKSVALQVDETEYGLAVVSADGNSLSMDVFCPEYLRGSGALFFCEVPLSQGFVRQ